MKDGTSGEKKAKKDKKDKTEHHHHHHDEKKHRRHHRDKTADKGIESTANSKPKGSVPVPDVSLTSRIVQEMHADPLPSPTSPSPKGVSVGKAPITSEAAKVTAKAPLPTENLGFIATLFKWVKENMFQPTFSRQKQISDAYSNQFSQTLTAIQKRFSANDARIETRAAGKALRFSGTKDEKAAVPTVDLSVTTPKPKTTIH